MARHTGRYAQSLPAMVSLTTGAPSLKVRMLKAATWLVGGNISSQLLRLASSMILTRLLVPEAFGLVAAINTLGLLGYLLKGAQRVGWPFGAEASIAGAVPLVVLAVWWSLRRLHHRIVGHGAPTTDRSSP